MIHLRVYVLNNTQMWPLYTLMKLLDGKYNLRIEYTPGNSFTFG